MPEQLLRHIYRPAPPTCQLSPFPDAPLLRAGTQIHTVSRKSQKSRKMRKSRERRPKTNGINLENLAMRRALNFIF